METLHLGSCVIRIFEDVKYLETILPDGTKVSAAANYDEASVKLSYELGYNGDTWLMSKEHELTHTKLAVEKGLDYSPALWRVAHPHHTGNITDDQLADEEAEVLEAQRRSNMEDLTLEDLQTRGITMDDIVRDFEGKSVATDGDIITAMVNEYAYSGLDKNVVEELTRRVLVKVHKEWGYANL